MLKISNYNNWNLQSQLLVSIQYGDMESCAKLLASGVDCDQTFKINSQLQTALCLSVQRGLYQIVQLLIKSGCSINRRDSNGKTPLIHVCENGYMNIMKLLLENRADVNLSDDFMERPISIIIQRPSFQKWDCLNLLLKYGCNVNLRNQDGQTPAHIACKMNDIKSLKILLCAGAETNTVDRFGSTPLRTAVSLGNIDMIRLLISSGAMNENIEKLNLDNLDNQSKMDLIKSLKNPLSLLEHSRNTLCKYFSPYTHDSLLNYKTKIPKCLISYLNFE